MMKRLNRLWVLYSKEWLRLRRNPAALMAVGLLILMALLVSIESKASAQAKRASRGPCLVVYPAEDDFIRHLKANQHPRLPVRFQALPRAFEAGVRMDYPARVSCVAEIGMRRTDSAANTDSAFKTESARAERRVLFRYAGTDLKQINGLSRWVLAGLAAYHSGDNIQQGLRPLPAKAAATASSTFDLGSSKSKAVVGAMLMFSTQFFVCCALFISLTAHERERGITQALAMTTAGPGEQWLAKFLFHLTLSLLASAVILQILMPVMLQAALSWLLIVCSSIGLISIATLLTSLSRSQTSASLMGFCYLMLVGVVFALAQNFPAFDMLRGFMFEFHSISLQTLLLDRPDKDFVVKGLIHTANLMIMPVLLMGLAIWVWKRRGWRQP